MPVAAAIRPLISNAPVLQVRVLVGLIILLGLVVLIGDGLQGRPETTRYNTTLQADPLKTE